MSQFGNKIAKSKTRNPIFISDTPTALDAIKYSSLAPGKPARKTTTVQMKLAITFKYRLPHMRPMLQIPVPVAARLSINPTGGTEA